MSKNKLVIFLLANFLLLFFYSCSIPDQAETCLDPNFEFDSYSSVDASCKQLLYNPVLSNETSPLEKISADGFLSEYNGSLFSWNCWGEQNYCLAITEIDLVKEDNFELEFNLGPTLTEGNSGIFIHGDNDCSSSYGILTNSTEMMVVEFTEEGFTNISVAPRASGFFSDIYTVRKIGEYHYFFLNHTLIHKSSTIEGLGPRFGIYAGAKTAGYVYSIFYSKFN